jgi:hypothetical protein
MKSERSVRDMIVEIESRARSGRESPRFAPELRALSPEVTSWNRRSPRRSRSRSPGGRPTSREEETFRPQVNIIGCHQTQELILSKADDRIRKQLIANEVRLERCEQERNRVLKMILDQETKAERIAAHLKLQHSQRFVLKIIAISRYVKHMLPIIHHDLQMYRCEVVKNKAATTLSRFLMNWHQRLHAQKYLMIFKSLLRSHGFFFLQLRILYKRQCVKRLKTFFEEIVARQKVRPRAVKRVFVYFVWRVRSRGECVCATFRSPRWSIVSSRA